jgi:hypothetical protein
MHLLPSWSEFENYPSVEVEFLHLQPFMSCHLHFAVVECAMMGKVHQSVGGVCYNTVILITLTFVPCILLLYV